MDEKIKGRLVIIGGGEDKSGKCDILKKVTELSGGNKANIAIVTVATQKPKEYGNIYTGLFKKMDISKVNMVNIENRKDANDPNNIKILNEASCVFFYWRGSA